ncbi:MAG: SDR family oxidoreductase [Solirubrobacterales bacterium]
MRVAIAGGHGKIARLLTELLSARGDQVVSLIRNPAHADDVRAAGAEPAVADLETESPAAIATTISGSGAVVFAAGAGPGSGAERKETVDHQAAVTLIDAARLAQIDRYLMISSMAADPDHAGEDIFDVYLRAKGRADAALRASGLRETIIRPGMLTDDPPTGLVTLAESVTRGAISRADVAAVLLACLSAEQTIGQTLELVGGTTPIDQALATL